MATVDLPYIERNMSRHKRVRLYFRFDGRRLGRLPDDPDSEQFFREYWRLRRMAEAGAVPVAPAAGLAGAPLPGSFRFLCVAYLSSDPFRRLDATTQAKRRAIIDSMLLDPVRPGDARIFADMPMQALDVANIEVLRDRKKDTPFAADERLKVLRQVFETTRPGRDGKPEKIVRENRALLVKPFRIRSEGHHTIRPEELAQYIRHHGVRSKAVLALAVLMFTGLRVSDASLLGPQHRRGDEFRLRIFKNRNRAPVTLTIPVHPVLDMVIGWHKPRGMNYLMTGFGRPYSIKGLGNRISEWFGQAGLDHCTAHTVRKGLATLLSENEATDSMLDGLFGWKDGKTSKIYTRQKQQAKLARQAILRIDWGEMGNLLPHPDEGVEIPAATSDKKAI
nr:tyrosine-type recombinase/integrase [Mesorhizobium sp.]